MPRSGVHTANGSTLSILSLLEFGLGIKKERQKETEHQHNEFMKVNVNAHAALCCSLSELSHHIYDMGKKRGKDKNDNQNVQPVSLFPPSLPPLFIIISLCRNVRSQKLPDRALVHF